jgi:hypothetical protein
MRIKIILFLMLLFAFASTQSQNIQYAHYVIDTMCSPTFYGRGYTSQGDTKAASFIANEFAKMRLSKFKNNYFQEYQLSSNTFSKEMKVSIGKKVLTAGIDFMVALSSPSIHGKFKIFKIDSINLKTKADIDKILKKNLKKKIVLIDKQNIKDKEVLAFLTTLKHENPFLSKGIAFINDGKLSWGASDGKKQKDFAKINLLRKSLPAKLKKIDITVEADYLIDYTTQNVVGYVKGKLYPDSFFVFTAHYDHLGQMGKDVFFPGANDNASGTAMVMDLARYFSTDTIHRPDYSIVFALVSGEENGLYGSTHLANQPLFPLHTIKFLINLDMVGTGSEGITVVNATKFKNEFNRFNDINKEKGYLKAVVERGESCNSDHCPFFEKGVPAVFIYAMGDFSEYHNVYDLPDKIPLSKYNEIFKLLVDYMKD